MKDHADAKKGKEDAEKKIIELNKAVADAKKAKEDAEKKIKEQSTKKP